MGNGASVLKPKITVNKILPTCPEPDDLSDFNGQYDRFQLQSAGGYEDRPWFEDDMDANPNLCHHFDRMGLRSDRVRHFLACESTPHRSDFRM